MSDEHQGEAWQVAKMMKLGQGRVAATVVGGFPPLRLNFNVMHYISPPKKNLVKHMVFSSR